MLSDSELALGIWVISGQFRSNDGAGGAGKSNPVDRRKTLAQNGARLRAVAALRQVDGRLSHASGDDRFLLLILRFATAAGAAIAGAAVMH